MAGRALRQERMKGILAAGVRRIFYLCLLVLTALSLPAQPRQPLSRFERAVRCVKYFEGWHGRGRYPYYLKTNIIQRFTEEFVEDEDVEAITNGVPYDNNEGVRPYFCTLSQSQAHQRIASFPLHTIKISSKFGYRMDPFTKKRRLHNGIDLRASIGTETFAMLPGIITTIGRDRSRGNYVIIRHGNYVVTYCHLSRILVRQGQMVEPGEAVGLVGSTGRSTGPHLHLMLHRGKQLLNPQILLDCIWRILVTLADCGQRGCMPRLFSHSLSDLLVSQEGGVCLSVSGMTSLYAASRASLFCFESARA